MGAEPAVDGIGASQPRVAASVLPRFHINPVDTQMTAPRQCASLALLGICFWGRRLSEPLGRIGGRGKRGGFPVDLISWGFIRRGMSKLGTKKLVVVGGLLWVSVVTSLTSCSTVLSKIPAEKLAEPARSMVLDARKERAELLKQYSVGSAQMLLALAEVHQALGYEDEALALIGQAAVLRQSSSSEREAHYKQSNKLIAKAAKRLSASDHKGTLSQDAYNRHVRLRSTARDKQFNLLITRAIPEIVSLTKAAKKASTIEKAAIIAQADRYITVITDFKKIDDVEVTVDELAKGYGLAVKKRKEYKIDAALKKAMPSGDGLLGKMKF